MSQKQILAPLQLTPSNAEYDPHLCKTCQRKGLRQPRPARTVYSDCQEHYKRRIRQLLLTGVYIIQKR